MSSGQVEAGEPPSFWLDTIRGLAALLVVVGHVRGSVFVAWGDLVPESQCMANYAAFAITKLGREAVVIFFVLSGYLVGGNAAVRFAAGKFDWRNYAAARVARLYSVLLPALALTALFDAQTGIMPESRTSETLAGNLVFLQHRFVVPFGTNAPLWSLAHEFWFYALCGAFLALLGSLRGHRTQATLASGLLVIVIAWVMGVPVFTTLPLWLLGAAAKLLRPICTAHRRKITLLALAGTAVGVILSWKFACPQTDFLLALPFSAILASLGSSKQASGVLHRLAAGLSTISFSLYAIHYPMLKLISAKWLQERLPQADARGWILVIGLTLLFVLLSIPFWFLFEKHHLALRSFLLNNIFNRTAKPTATK